MASGLFGNTFDGMGDFASKVIGVAGSVFSDRANADARKAEVNAAAQTVNLQTMVASEQTKLLILGSVAALVAFLILKRA